MFVLLVLLRGYYIGIKYFSLLLNVCFVSFVTRVLHWYQILFSITKCFFFLVLLRRYYIGIKHFYIEFLLFDSTSMCVLSKNFSNVDIFLGHQKKACTCAHQCHTALFYSMHVKAKLLI